MKLGLQVINSLTKISRGDQKLLVYLEKQVMLHLSLADITTVSNFTAYSKVKLLSHRESQGMFPLSQGYTSNIFTQGKSFNFLINLHLLFPLLDSEVLFYKVYNSNQIAINNINKGNYYYYYCEPEKLLLFWKLSLHGYVL